MSQHRDARTHKGCGVYKYRLCGPHCHGIVACQHELLTTDLDILPDTRPCKLGGVKLEAHTSNLCNKMTTPIATPKVVRYVLAQSLVCAPARLGPPTHLWEMGMAGWVLGHASF